MVQVLGLEELTAERAACQNPTGLDTKGLKESVDVVRDVFVAANCAAGEAGLLNQQDASRVKIRGHQNAEHCS